MKLMVSLFFLFIAAFPVFAISEKENVYLVNLKCVVEIFVQQPRERTDRVKERKDGRWVYYDKLIKYFETVKEKREVEIIEIVEAGKQAEIKKKIMEKFAEKGYVLKKIVKIQQVK